MPYVFIPQAGHIKIVINSNNTPIRVIFGTKYNQTVNITNIVYVLYYNNYDGNLTLKVPL